MSPSGWLTSAVARAVGPYPLVMLRVRLGTRLGDLLTWLIAPPVEPRPNMTADGPLRTSTDSRLNVSRVYMTEVADAVDEDVVARREPAQGEVVALGASALARGDADAGHVAQGVAQAEGGLLAHHLERHHRDGLRRVLKRIRESSELVDSSTL